MVAAIFVRRHQLAIHRCHAGRWNAGFTFILIAIAIKIIEHLADDFRTIKDGAWHDGHDGLRPVGNLGCRQAVAGQSSIDAIPLGNACTHHCHDLISRGRVASQCLAIPAQFTGRGGRFGTDAIHPRRTGHIFEARRQNIHHTDRSTLHRFCVAHGDRVGDQIARAGRPLVAGLGDQQWRAGQEGIKRDVVVDHIAITLGEQEGEVVDRRVTRLRCCGFRHNRRRIAPSSSIECTRFSRDDSRYRVTVTRRRSHLKAVFRSSGRALCSRACNHIELIVAIIARHLAGL